MTRLMARLHRAVRRYAGFALVVAAVCRCSAQTLPARPVVGAIRWDAWTGGVVTRAVEASLGPEKYRDRLPWFAKVIDRQTVSIDGNRQE